MHSEMCPVRQNPIQRTVRTAHLSLLMTVHNTAQNSSDNLHSYLHCAVRLSAILSIYSVACTDGLGNRHKMH